MTITVLMSAYNAARFLPQAIESVLGQTHRDFEFIIIDDGSTDDTLALTRSYAGKDSRIKIITRENRGFAPSLNEGMQKASGEWIARIDADDVMMPNRLERQIEFLQKHPDLVVASSLVFYIDGTDRVIGKNQSKFTTRQAVADCVAQHLPVGFHHPAVIFRKTVIESLGGYRSAFSPAEDMDLWNRVIDAGHAVLVQDEHLTQYRIHSSSVTVQKFRVSESKARWVEACIWARHHNQPEPTWEQMLAKNDDMSWARQLNATRREYGRAIYKAATLDYSRRQYRTFFVRIVAAILLEPWYVLPRILPQFKRN